MKWPPEADQRSCFLIFRFRRLAVACAKCTVRTLTHGWTREKCYRVDTAPPNRPRSTSVTLLRGRVRCFFQISFFVRRGTYETKNEIIIKEKYTRRDARGQLRRRATTRCPQSHVRHNIAVARRCLSCPPHLSLAISLSPSLAGRQL